MFKLKKLVIRRSPNNIFITLLNFDNSILTWLSARRVLKEKKKLKWKAVVELLQPIMVTLKKNESCLQFLFFKGAVSNPKGITRALYRKGGVKILRIIADVQPPHNGCRLPRFKRRKRAKRPPRRWK